MGDKKKGSILFEIFYCFFDFLEERKTKKKVNFNTYYEKLVPNNIYKIY